MTTVLADKGCVYIAMGMAVSPCGLVVSCDIAHQSADYFAETLGDGAVLQGVPGRR